MQTTHKGLLGLMLTYFINTRMGFLATKNTIAPWCANIEALQYFTSKITDLYVN